MPQLVSNDGHLFQLSELAAKQSNCPMPEGTVRYLKVEKWDGSSAQVLAQANVQKAFNGLHQRALVEGDMQFVSDDPDDCPKTVVPHPNPLVLVPCTGIQDA